MVAVGFQSLSVSYGQGSNVFRGAQVKICTARLWNLEVKGFRVFQIIWRQCASPVSLQNDICGFWSQLRWLGLRWCFLGVHDLEIDPNRCWWTATYCFIMGANLSSNSCESQLDYKEACPIQLSVLSSTYQKSGMGCKGLDVMNFGNSFLIWSLRVDSSYKNFVPGSEHIEIRTARFSNLWVKHFLAFRIIWMRYACLVPLWNGTCRLSDPFG
jgi:hypothetical protein